MHIPLFILRGDIKKKHCQGVFVKSHISYFLFQILWPLAKIIDFFRFWNPKIIQEIEYNNQFDVKGFFLYLARDSRKRKYIILNTSDNVYFLKTTNKPTREFFLNSDIIKLMKKNYFHPITVNKIYQLKNGEFLHFYNFYEYGGKLVRLDTEMALKFSATLNHFTKTKYITFKSYTEKNDFKLFTNKNILFELVKNYKIEIGLIHGDLISNNIFKLNDELNFIDWETFQNNQPLLIDYIGSLDWSYIENKIKWIKSNLDNLSNHDLDIVCFVLICSFKNIKNSQILIS